MGAALGLVLLGGLAGGSAPLALKRLVEALQTSDGERSLAAVLAYIAALVGQRLCEQGQAYAFGRGEQRLARTLSARSFAHLLRLPMRFHLAARGGALTQALSDGAIGLRLILTHLVTTLAPAAVQLAVAVAVLVSVFGLASGLGFAATFIAYALVFAWGVARQGQPARDIAAAQLDAAALAADGLLNIETLKAYTAERRYAERYDQALAAREQRWRVFLSRRLWHGLAVAAVFAAGFGPALWLASRAVPAGRLPLASFVLLAAYLLQLTRPLEMIGFAARDLAQSRAYLEGLLTILAQAREATGSAAPAPARPAGADLRLEAVRFVYGEGPGLGPISFHAAPGAFIGVVGATGSGKSTLLRLLLRFLEPDAGVIRLDGRPIGELPLEALRAQIALVSQETILLNDSIGANIAFATGLAEEREVWAAVEAARLGDLVTRLPQGLQTPVGERGLRLSGGERQRVALARAALKRARLVLFDEATAALDPLTERAVWAAVRALGEATVLAVTHRLSTVAAADEILVLEQGRLVERGSHAVLLRRNGVYTRLWAAQTSDLAGAPGSGEFQAGGGFVGARDETR